VGGGRVGRLPPPVRRWILPWSMRPF